MDILVVGSGGREHALCWKLAKSPEVKTVYIAPGNGGTEDVAQNVALDIMDNEKIVEWCKEKGVTFVVVGPEAPLANGITDALTAAGIKSFGPTKAAAQLEASKNFTKKLCDKYNIPTAAYGFFTDKEEAKKYVEKIGAPIVVKADGLAAGKGVVVAQSIEEAHTAVEDILGGLHGGAGASIVIEQFLDGEEVSLYAVSDGETALYVGSAQDHKAVGDGDMGPNTGGMGAYTPAPVLTPELLDRIMDTIVAPTVKGMKEDGCPFTGVLFAGLMIMPDGSPMLLEYNVRFGDPETQVVLPALKADLFPILKATADGTLSTIPKPEFESGARLCVVYCAKGYPGSYEKGTEIKNLEGVEATGVTVFHAGTKKVDGKILANGGRVLGISGQGTNVGDAKKNTYRAIILADWPEGFYRKDIGYRAVAREKEKDKA